MEFEITKEELLRPLQKVVSVADKKNLQPILSFVLLTFSDNELIISATDSDIELCAKTEIMPQNFIGKIVLPAKKLFDICKSLPDKSSIKLSTVKENKLTLISNKSKFTLSSLEAQKFPFKQETIDGFSFELTQGTLKSLLNYTSFAVAQQDVRHYLMGMLWEFSNGIFNAVATDGHRLALASYKDETVALKAPLRVIVPRKGIAELLKLLDQDNACISLHISDKLIQIATEGLTFTTKLIDAQFPDYSRVFPDPVGAKYIVLPKDKLKEALTRVSILSNEKHKAVRFCLSYNQLVIAANNQEHEQAEELLTVDYSHEPLELCFNYAYLVDVLGKIPTDNINIQVKQANTPILIRPFVEDNSGETVDSSSDSSVKQLVKAELSYIIMPMCL